jgi:hypothetical protein
LALFFGHGVVLPCICDPVRQNRAPPAQHPGV